MVTYGKLFIRGYGVGDSSNKPKGSLSSIVLNPRVVSFPGGKVWRTSGSPPSLSTSRTCVEYYCHISAPLSRGAQLHLCWFSQLFELFCVLGNCAVAIPGDVGN